MSFSRRVDDQTAVHPHQGIILSVVREPPANGQDNLDEAQRLCAERHSPRGYWTSQFILTSPKITNDGKQTSASQSRG